MMSGLIMRVFAARAFVRVMILNYHRMSDIEIYVKNPHETSIKMYDHLKPGNRKQVFHFEKRLI